MIMQIKNWLSQDVFPLWLARGVDWERGGFVENLSLDGSVRRDPRRSMVQCRQLYSFRIGSEMGVLSKTDALAVVGNAAKALIRNYSEPSGAFRHTVDEDGRMIKATPELYTQAFVLFGLAQSYALLGAAELKTRAERLLDYLDRERRVPGGGYTEIGDKGQALYLSNPHMHLFEAALAWMELDDDPRWYRFADRLLQLCLDRFIDPATGLLAEHFDENWVPRREVGRFYFEPGHQYEWSWLMGRYQRLTGVDLSEVRRRFFERSEAHGVDGLRKAAWDQVWSDYEPKLRSSRFWPQTERIKVASQLAVDGLSDFALCTKAAEEGMRTLFLYLRTPVAGLWYDTWETDGRFSAPAVKASSLYHIIGAMSEYSAFRSR